MRGTVARASTGCVIGFLLLALLAVPAAPGQSPAVPVFSLEPGRRIPLNTAGIPFFDRGKCDGDGNVYVRLLPGRFDPHMFSTPVTEFSSDGEQRAVFSLAAAPRWDPGDILDFAIGPNGRVYLLVDRPNKQKRKMENGILVFDLDGALRSTVHLELALDTINKLAVFSTGDLLVLGAKKAEQQPPHIPGTPAHRKNSTDDRPPVNPVAYVVGQDGRLLKSIRLPESLIPGSVRHPGPPLTVSATAGDTADLVMDEYGHTAYLMFQKSEPVVYTISPAGTVIRSFPIQPPPGGYSAISMNWADGLGLLLETAHIVKQGFLNSQVRFSVVDPQTGERLNDYRLGPNLGAALACFSRQRIAFLTTTKGKLTMTEADIR
jgi:hypothetical protein